MVLSPSSTISTKCYLFLISKTLFICYINKLKYKFIWTPSQNTIQTKASYFFYTHTHTLCKKKSKQITPVVPNKSLYSHFSIFISPVCFCCKWSSNGFSHFTSQGPDKDIVITNINLATPSTWSEYKGKQSAATHELTYTEDWHTNTSRWIGIAWLLCTTRPTRPSNMWMMTWR